MCMSQSSVSRCVTQVSSCINEILLERYVKFPLAPRDITNAQQRFMTKYHFPGVVGILDCTHVAIVPPAVNDPDLPEHMFVNRKGYHSINVQLICNADLTILNVNARYGGATHDAFIWANSRAMVEMREMHTRNGHTSWLLGDSGYPLQQWLLTPVVGAAPGTPEYLYTSRHVATRSCIERCNGVLKSRFRCLRKDRVLHYKPTKAASIINACAVLHNLAIAVSFDALYKLIHCVKYEYVL
ncbi:putative nuclease HARBI1 [Bacillus rossius redtenbacheri]|uniref:putative nuclease HARBI1 n=1 Tax=Bacillus rossius redtenbacheri TaxID=93214 RepID=UPI002FDE49F2